MAALTGCLVIAGSSQAMAAQRYASPSGSGSACKQMSPCAIQIAASGADMGDEVIVAPGDYSPPGSVITAVPNVYIHGVLGQPMPRIHFTAGFLGIITSGDRGSWLSVDATTSAALETENGGSADMIVSHVTGANAQACYDYSTLTDSVCWESGANGTGAEAQTGTTDTITMRNVTLEATGSGGIGARIQADTGGNVTANLTNVIARGTSGDLTLVQQGAPPSSRISTMRIAAWSAQGEQPSTRPTRRPRPRSWSTRPPETFANWRAHPRSTPASPTPPTGPSTCSASRA